MFQVLTWKFSGCYNKDRKERISVNLPIGEKSFQKDEEGEWLGAQDLGFVQKSWKIPLTTYLIHTVPFEESSQKIPLTTFYKYNREGDFRPCLVARLSSLKGNLQLKK